MISLITQKPETLIASSLEILASMAQQMDLAVFHTQLQHFAKASPKGVQALLSAMKNAGLEIGGTAPLLSASQTIVSPKIGDFVEGRGVYVGAEIFPLKPAESIIDFYCEPRFLTNHDRSSAGHTFVDANKQLAALNGGRTYRNGTAQDIRKAMNEGDYTCGDYFIPFTEFLDGSNAQGETVRYWTVIRLIDECLALKQIREHATTLCGNGCPVLSSTGIPNQPDFVRKIPLIGSGDLDDWFCEKRSDEALLLPFRAFKRQAATDMAPA